MRVTNSIYRSLLDRVSDIAIISRASTLVVTDLNQAAVTHLGRPRKSLLGQPLSRLVPNSDERSRMEQQVELLRRTARIPQASLRVCLGDKVRMPLLVSLTIERIGTDTPWLSLVATRGSHGRSGMDGALDALTGLPLRPVLEERLSQLRAAHQRGQLHAILFVDIDHFKRVNDGYGHLAGDAVLRGVAERLLQCLRPKDLVVRFGGDEFVALVPSLRDPAEADGIAERIQAAMRAPFLLSQGAIRVTASVGISLGRQSDQINEQLVHQADRAMYQAKSLGQQGLYVVLSAS